ncbi:MAG TPA: amidohydrolase [Candidatus Ventricola gallistercoris]|nr:amidohydrolase [Candidatus Ventricola gallistercoris]
MLAQIEEIQPDLTALRRDFHHYPETGWLEMRTSAVIAKRLTELGYRVLTGRDVCQEGARLGVPAQEELEAHAQRALEQGAPQAYLTQDMREGYTGVIGILECGEGPTLAMRFDIDALGMCECEAQSHRPRAEGFASENPGMMHACGHDGHAAIGLGIAQILMAHREELHGTVKLLFQPGEEGARGAGAMVAKGHLDDVDVFIGSHIAPTESLDDGDVTAGTWGSLATVKYDVTFLGEAAHAGGYPEKGHNALLAAASAVLALHAIPRHSGGQSRVNVGTLHAGTGRNVVPDRATMQLEVRGETTEINTFMEESALAACRGAAMMQGCTLETTVMGRAEGQHSDLALIERIGDVVRRDLPHLRLSSEQNARNWGSEDISLMMNRVQAHGGLATYMRVMTPVAGAQHTVTFDFDEAVLGRSVAVFCAVALDILGA